MRRRFSDSLVPSYTDTRPLQEPVLQLSTSTSNQSGTSQSNARNSSGPSSSAATGAGFELESSSTAREEATDDGTIVETRSDGQLKEDERGVKWVSLESSQRSQ